MSAWVSHTKSKLVVVRVDREYYPCYIDRVKSISEQRQKMKNTYRLFWTRSDKQGDIKCGEYGTQEAAEAAIPEALTALLDQCAAEDMDDIREGSFSIESCE